VGFLRGEYSKSRTASHASLRWPRPPSNSDNGDPSLKTLLETIQKCTVLALAGMLAFVVLLSTLHLGVLIAQEVWAPPRFLIRVQGLLEIFGYFLLVLIGVELLETLKAYLRKDVIHVRVVLEVALIAMARKVIIEEPNTVPSATLLGIAALILALGIAFYFERQAKRETVQPA
jgi:uncharacterized membrane protein (DUF373 family)